MRCESTCWLAGWRAGGLAGWRAGGQHADDYLRAVRCGLGVGGDGHAIGGELVACGLREVKRAHLVACVVQVQCHGAAHVAQADECDFHGGLLLPVVV